MFLRKDKKSNHSHSNGSTKKQQQQQQQQQNNHQQQEHQFEPKHRMQYEQYEQQQQYNFVNDDHPLEQPSYVNISRVNHGYVPYNRYTSEYRKDESLLRYDEYQSLPLEDNSKGYLHRKIQSLYGETFADDWEKTRIKKGNSIELLPESNKNINQIKTTLASSKLFQKINSIDNSDLDSKVDKDADKDWWLREHQANRMHGSNDGAAFLDKLKEQRNKIQNKIQRYEFWLQNTSNDIPEECIGKIRAAIGKANLLLDKKFQQFEKLCQDSINQGDKEEFKIQNDDLQGFWDMVMLQINDVNQTYEQLIKLKQNNWINRMEQEPIKTISPRITRSKYDSNNNNKTANTTRILDDERQRKLMEIKRKGKNNLKNDQMITIFTSNSKQQ